MTETAEQPGEMIPPPRAVTARGARHAWGDMRVRFWWLCALAMLVIVLVVGIDQVQGALRERKLISNGVVVPATVIFMDGSTRVGWAQPRTDSHQVRLKAKMPDGSTKYLEGTIEPGEGMLQVGGEINVKVDPNDPARWTDRTEPLSWTTELAIPLLMSPIILILLGVAMLRRSQVLSIWRSGRWTPGVVIDVRHSAAAPLSRLVRYSLPELDKRIFSALIPVSAGIPEPEEALDIVAIPDAPQRAVVAKLYRA